MNLSEATTAHAKRLRNLTDTEVRNLMEHADAKTPLLPCSQMDCHYVDSEGRC